jgi:serine/threonine protein kinase
MPRVGRTIIANRFEMLGLAGKGGMGEVFRARDLRTGHVVALKISPVACPRLEAQLLFEAHALGGCRARGVPRLIAHGDAGGGKSFVAMEWREGRRVTDLIREALPLDRIVEIVLDLLAVAGRMHAAGWIHGDINPSNVLVKDAGRGRPSVSMVDLGLARRPFPDDEAHLGDEVCGTPSFMAPELLRGAPTSVASDLYAIGGIFYALLTGALPVSGTSPVSVVMKVVASDAEVMCDCGDGPLAAVLRQALHRDPARRFTSAREMQEAILAAVLSDEPCKPPAPRRRSAVDPEAMTLAA